MSGARPPARRRADRKGAARSSRLPGRSASTVIVVGVALVVGCSTLQPAGEGGGEAASGPAPQGDTAGAAAARGDSAGSEPAAADSTLRALRDSARAMRERYRQGGDSVGSDSAGRRPERPPAADSAGGYPHGPVTTVEVDSLRSLGPVYTPYDRGPVMRKGDYLDGLLRAAVVPAIQNHDLSPETWARFWVLVGPRGRVRETELHLGSGHAAFDAAAHAVAERLRYLPAERDGTPVPVWVLARISLLMG